MKNRKKWLLLLLVAAIYVISRIMKKELLQRMIDFTAPLEGFRSVAYWDVRAYSIGYGSQTIDGKPVLKGQIITQEKALIELAKRLQLDSSRVRAAINVPLTDNQIIALTDFMYNAGPAVAQSTLFKLINAKASKDAITTEWRRWKFAGGVVEPVLIARREKEIKQYYA